MQSSINIGLFIVNIIPETKKNENDKYSFENILVVIIQALAAKAYCEHFF